MSTFKNEFSWSISRDRVFQICTRQYYYNDYDKKTSRIRCQLEGVNYFDEDDWPKMVDFMSDALDRLVSSFGKLLKVEHY